MKGKARRARARKVCSMNTCRTMLATNGHLLKLSHAWNEEIDEQMVQQHGIRTVTCSTSEGRRGLGCADGRVLNPEKTHGFNTTKAERDVKGTLCYCCICNVFSPGIVKHKTHLASEGHSVKLAVPSVCGYLRPDARVRWCS